MPRGRPKSEEVQWTPEALRNHKSYILFETMNEESQERRTQSINLDYDH